MSLMTPVTTSMAGNCPMVSLKISSGVVVFTNGYIQSWISAWQPFCTATPPRSTPLLGTTVRDFCIKKEDEWPTKGPTVEPTFLTWIWIWRQTPSHEHPPRKGSHSTRQWQNSCYILTPLSKISQRKKCEFIAAQRTTFVSAVLAPWQLLESLCRAIRWFSAKFCSQSSTKRSCRKKKCNKFWKKPGAL